MASLKLLAAICGFAKTNRRRLPPGNAYYSAFIKQNNYLCINWSVSRLFLEYVPSTSNYTHPRENQNALALQLTSLNTPGPRQLSTPKLPRTILFSKLPQHSRRAPDKLFMSPSIRPPSRFSIQLPG